jgi:hypothetical protein
MLKKMYFFDFFNAQFFLLSDDLLRVISQKPLNTTLN